MTSRHVALNPAGEVTFTLREQALDALRAATRMLDVAANLLKQGNSEEADRLRDAARAKRDEYMLLLAKANGMRQSTRRVH